MPTLTSFSNRPLDRAQFIKLIDTALTVKEFSYARLLALAWLTTFPGDLGVGLRHARALVGLGMYRQAIPVLETICQADPEFLEAQQLLALCAGRLKHPASNDAQASIVALSSGPAAHGAMPAPRWGRLLRQAKSYQARQTGAKSAAEQARPAGGALGGEYSRLVHAALLENPASPLAALAHLYFMREGRDRGEIVADAVTSLARAYHGRWPRCLAFSLLLADQLMDHGAGEEAVALLHQVASRDVTAQVALRIWGEDHPYRSLWPDRLAIEPVSSLAGATSPQGLPIPAPVAAALGWNQLATGTVHPEPAAISIAKSGEVSRPRTRPRSAEAAIRSTHPERSGATDIPHTARFPVYVILSDRQVLQQTYGLAPSRRVEAAARRLVRAVANRPDWGAMLFIPPVRPAPYTPWDLKLALADLDETLAARGERIGALLILGGPEIVPFHMLPNPVDDSDDAVPSDNPYATRDENYFVAEWPVGRLPSGAGSDPSLMIESLERFTAYHSRGNGSPTGQRPWLQRWFENLARLVRPPALAWPAFLQLDGFASYGYTAAVWQRASLSVFRPIGQGNRLKVSPPEAIDTQVGFDSPQLRLPPARLAYFNLHGQRDSALWYGQSDPTSGPVGKSEAGRTVASKRRLAKKDEPDPLPGAAFSNPDFPVALRPVDIFPGLDEPGFGWLPEWLAGPAPKKSIPGAIFSEACFGAHVEGRSTDQAIALTFLRAGAYSFVGSTCIAYGAISMPLTAADLLGHSFWQFLMDGHPAGEALRRAKVFLSTEMDRRQGYLDGEDQKTLISFVLYGDPLYQDPSWSGGGMAVRAPKHHLPESASLEDALTYGLDPEPQPVHTVCDRAGCCPSVETGEGKKPGGEGSLPPEVLANVREIVSKYLPGMANASMKLADERAAGQGQPCSAHGAACPTAQLGAKAATQQAVHLDRRVVTLSKTITRPVNESLEGQPSRTTITHQQFARLTLDASAKLVKLVVSR